MCCAFSTEVEMNKNKKNGKNTQRDANTARTLAVVRFGHCPPAVTNPDRTDYNTLPQLASVQCKDYV